MVATLLVNRTITYFTSAVKIACVMRYGRCHRFDEKMFFSDISLKLGAKDLRLDLENNILNIFSLWQFKFMKNVNFICN